MTSPHILCLRAHLLNLRLLHNKSRISRCDQLALLWAVCAVLFHPLIPWFFWATLLALPVCVLLWDSRLWLRSRHGVWVISLCCILTALHVGWAGFRVTSYNAAIAETFWRDDHSYFTQASEITAAWKSGFYPEIWRYGPPPYLGTLHTGYHRLLAASFYFFGASTFVGLVISGLALAWLPLLSALTARYVFSDEEVSEGCLRSSPGSTLGVPLVAAFLTALHPSQYYWAGFLMKDAWTAVVFMAALALIAGAFRRRSLSLAVAALLVLPYIFSVRMYAGASLLIGALLLPAMRYPIRQILAVVCVGVAAASILVITTETGHKIYNQMAHSITVLLPPGLYNPFLILVRLAAGIPRLFLAPYGWVILSEPTPMYGLYPGMWFLYVLVYPFAFAGMYRSACRNNIYSVLLFVAFGFAALILLAASFGGNASRQRYYVEYIMVLFAAVGFCYPARKWIVGVYVAEIMWMIGQSISMAR